MRRISNARQPQTGHRELPDSIARQTDARIAGAAVYHLIP